MPVPDVEEDPEAELSYQRKGSKSTQNKVKEYQEGRYHHEIRLKPSIYCAVVYAPAVSRIRNGSMWHRRTNTVLCMSCCNFIIQIGLLWVMFIYAFKDVASAEIVTTDAKKHEKEDLSSYRPYRKKSADEVFMIAPDDDRKAGEMHKDVHEEVAPKIDESDSVCTLVDGTFTCEPTSIHFTQDWHRLDRNRDGVWSKAEALGMEDGFAGAVDKKNIVFFQTIIQSLLFRAEWLQEQNKTLYLAQDIVAKRGIPKAYFDYWIGDAKFCSHFRSSTCKSIVASGIFDEALAKGKIAAAYKGISDYSSAVGYCTMMLDSHGGCEKSLPAVYVKSVWKRESVCGEMTLQSAGVMTNPSDPDDVMQVMAPKYKGISRQQKASEGLFIFVFMVIMFLFYASLVTEIKDIFRQVDFLITFPSTLSSQDMGGVDRTQFAESTPRQDDDTDTKPKQYKFERITTMHRTILIIVTVLRVFVLLSLLSFGTWFLLRCTHYVDLVLNAVALAFIIETDEMLYDTFLDPIDRKEMGLKENCQPPVYLGFMPSDDSHMSGKCCAKHTWGLVFVPILAIGVVLFWQFHIRNPAVKGLLCACLQQGSDCAESIENSGGWWKYYWTHTLPSVMHHIEAMRLQGL